MSNDDMSKDLQFEKQIEEFSEPEKFLAREIRKVQKECASRATCYPVQAQATLSKKQIAIGGISVGGITTLVVYLYDLIVNLLNNTPPPGGG